MEFKELKNALYPKMRKIIVSTIINTDTCGIKFENISVGKVEIITLPGNEGDVIFFSELRDEKDTVLGAGVCILIRETEVVSIDEHIGKIIVLIRNGAYSISLN